MVADKNKQQAIDTTIRSIEKQFGKGAIMRMGAEASLVESGVISTGSMSIDLALGVGGVPRGRVVEVYGPESGGKTTLSLHIVAEAQKTGGVAAFIDAEHALDPQYAAALGVDIDELLVSQPDTGEQALEITELLVRSGAVDIIVIDSVAALVPRAEIEGEMGQSHVGLQARLMSQALRKLTGVLAKSNTTAIFINQIREKVGVIYGSPETTPGGRALKFYSSVRMEVRRRGDVKSGTDKVGNATRVKITKNKVAPPFKEAEIDIMFGKGIDAMGDLINIASDLDIIQKSGSFYKYNNENIGQGKAKTGVYLQENPEVRDEVKELVLAAIKGDPKADAKADPKAEAKAEAKVDPKADVDSDAKAEAKLDAKAEAKPDADSDAKADAKEEAKSTETAAKPTKAKAKTTKKKSIKVDAEEVAEAASETE